MIGLVVIPAFNEEKTIRTVVKKVPDRIKDNKLDVLVVNDGSVDKTNNEVFQTRAILVSHIINRGLGAALGTGFEYAKRYGYDFLITLDGDGQHDPSEMGKLMEPVMKRKADFVVGTRIYRKGMPLTRRILTFLATVATYFFTGVWTTDSQSGFRAFSRRAIEQISISVDRMEVSSDFFAQAKDKGLNIVEVPIKPIYTEYSLRKGQNFFNSFNIIGKLTLNWLSR